MFASSSGPHVILLGNQKGGSGKSTLAMHIAIALIKAGQRVTTIDLDHEQRTLTRYMENRRVSAKAERYPLHVPEHFCIDDLRQADAVWRDADRIDALASLMRSWDHGMRLHPDRYRRHRRLAQPVRARARRYPHHPDQRQLRRP